MKTGIYNATFENENEISIDVCEVSDEATPGIFILKKGGIKKTFTVKVTDENNNALMKSEIVAFVKSQGFELHSESFSNPL